MTTYTLTFYKKNYPYLGEELGIYMGNGAAGDLCPQYATCNPFDLEKGTKTIPRETFLQGLKQLRDQATEQAKGKIGAAHPILVMRGPIHTEALQNTVRFTEGLIKLLEE